jgi:hypothetical protein
MIGVGAASSGAWPAVTAAVAVAVAALTRVLIAAGTACAAARDALAEGTPVARPESVRESVPTPAAPRVVVEEPQPLPTSVLVGARAD